MSMPDFDEAGLLPAGIWDASIEEVGERLGCFQQCDQRPRLWRKMRAFLHEVQGTHLVEAIILDGSFVTDEPRPNDIDLILVLNAEHNFRASLRPFEYNILSRRRVAKEFGFDILVAAVNTSEYREHVDFFSQIRGLDERTKGLLRIRL